MKSKRKLGNSDIEVAPIAFGGNVFGWTIDEKTSFQLLDAFVDYGFDLIDTANMYSAWVPGNQGGESESIIGNWLKKSGKRNQVVIATKVGMQMGDGSQGLKKENILKSAEDSLKRLNVECIDLYQSHKDDESTPIEETLSAYDTLIKQGKVRVIGASNFSPKRLRESRTLAKEKGLPTYESLQPLYNLYDRESFEKDMEPYCLKHNVGVISYYSLASGFLTGKYRKKEDSAKSARGSGVVEKYLNERGLKILKALDQVSERHKVTQAVIALSWLLHRKSITAPIVSATNLDQLSEIVKACDVTLSGEDLKLFEI